MQTVLELLEERRNFLNSNARIIIFEDVRTGDCLQGINLEFYDLDDEIESGYSFYNSLEVVGEELKNGMFIISCKKIN